MKVNVFERLRRWLIKKLGGYTEQFTPIQPQIIRQVDVQMQTVQAKISVAAPGADSVTDFKPYCENVVMQLLLKKLYDSGFILWESEYDKNTQKVNVRATLRVVNENDLKPYFLLLDGVSHGQ